MAEDDDAVLFASTDVADTIVVDDAIDDAATHVPSTQANSVAHGGEHSSRTSDVD